jgi:hypothetical protein
MNTFDSQRSSLTGYGDDSLESNPFADTPSQRESTMVDSSPFSQQPIETNTQLNIDQPEPEEPFEDENIYISKKEQDQDNEPLPTQLNTADLAINQLDQLTIDSPSQMEQPEHYHHQQQPEETETDTQVSR